MKSNNIVTTDSLARQDADHCQGTGGQVDNQQKGVIHNNNITITTQGSKKTLLRPASLQREMSIECPEPTRTTTNVPQKQNSRKSITLERDNDDDKNNNKDEEDDDYQSYDKKMTSTDKAQQLFDLLSDEQLIDEYPCYLLKLVTLPGWLYITNESLCFYAALPEKNDYIEKTGYLLRKVHKTSPLSTRSYFQLKNHVLSWYNSAEDKYEPIDSIDLKHIIDVQDSSVRKFGFQIVGEKRHWILAADSEVSQKEWMDELRRAIFIARNSGNSVRIILPFSRISNISRNFAFKFAQYIRIKLSHMNDLNNLDDEYYFAFFPDIEKTYHQIEELWNSKRQQQKKTEIMEVKSEQQEEQQKEEVKRSLIDSITNPGFSSQEDNLFNNTSGMSAAMLIGVLTNPASLLANNYTNNNGSKQQQQYRSINSDVLDANLASSSRCSTFSSAFETPTGSKDDAVQGPMNTTQSDNASNNNNDRNQQRNSWPFGWFSSPPLSPTMDSSSQQQQQKTRELSLPGIEPNDVTTTTISQQQKDKLKNNNSSAKQSKPVSKNEGRFRSSSTASIKQKARNTLGLPATPNNTWNKEQHQQKAPVYSTFTSPHTNSNTNSSSIITNAENKLLSLSAKTRHFRSSSFGEGLKRHIKTPSNSDLNALILGPTMAIYNSIPRQQQQLQASWIAPAYRDILQQTSMPPKATTQINDTDESQQALADQKLRKTFPMLGENEQVIGAFSTALWKTLPYYGRLLYSLNYICFYSKVLAGRQKLVIPITDITSVRRIKSRGYYFLHSIGLITQNMQEEIYLEFSSVDIRDSCYALLYILINEAKTDDEIKDYSRSNKMSDILATSTEHVMPPLGYNGPPLLSNTSKNNSFNKPLLPKSNMHITCLTIGSRGDVQPYIALCKELQTEGHRCRIASHSEYQSWVEDHGIEFRSIGGDPGELMKLCVDNGFLSYSFVKDGSKFFYTWFDELLATAWEACQGTDLLIESPSAMVGVHMAEKLEIPYFRSMPFPWTRTTRFPHPFAVQNYTSGRLLYNDMTYVIIDIALWAGTSKAINRFRRKKLGLPHTTREKLELWNVPHIYSFSPSVVAMPPDWADFIHCTGYWFLDNPNTSWKPSTELLQFLGNTSSSTQQKNEESKPIVYIGFGSIIVPDPNAMSIVIVEAVKQANVRAIVCKGWSSRRNDNTNQEGQQQDDDKIATDILQGSPDILNLDSVPHDWLFPQIQGVVHHGGAGTTAAGLRAGLPTVIKPFFGDQRFWGQRIEELGVGICISKLTTDKLIEALIEITHNLVTISKAKALGAAIQEENGLKKAVECIYRDIHLAKRGKE